MTSSAYKNQKSWGSPYTQYSLGVSPPPPVLHARLAVSTAAAKVDFSFFGLGIHPA